jgi:hypothetical protein
VLLGWKIKRNRSHDTYRTESESPVKDYKILIHETDSY